MIQFTSKNFLQVKVCGIYKIIIKDHFYIGSSKHINKRLKEHYDSLIKQRHHNIFFQRCFNKYGLENIYFDIVEICEEDKLIEREKYFIDILSPDINSILNPSKPIQNKLSILRQKLHKDINNDYQKIPVYKYNLKGIYIDSFDSVTEAGYFCNISPSNISACCKGRQKTAKGFIWKYFKTDKLYIQTKTKKKEFKTSKDLHNKKYVYQYDLDGNYLDSYCCAFEAELNTGINNSSISQCCRENGKVRSAGGYLWRYYKSDKINRYTNNSSKAKSKAINIFDLDTLKEYSFESIADAVRKLNIKTSSFDGACSCICSYLRQHLIYKNRYVIKYVNDIYIIKKNNRINASVKLCESGKVFEER